jgi:hypothetical protein
VPKSLKLLYSIMNLNTISLPWGRQGQQIQLLANATRVRTM